MKKKSLAGIMTAGLAALMLAGCSSQGGQETTAASAESGAAQESSAAAEETEAEAEEKKADGTLKVVATSEDYVKLFDKFTEETGIKTELLSMSSGEVLSKIKAEGGTPMADLWFGGGIDAFMGAKEDGLLEQVNFDEAANLAPEYKDADNYWFAKGLTVVGFVVNNDIIEEKGLEIVASEAFTADSNTDFSVQLDKAKEAGAELVFLPIYYQEASIILKQASDKDFHPMFFGCDGMDGILSVKNFDQSLAEGLMLLTPFTVDEAGSQDFVAAYEEAYGIEPLQFGAGAYDAVYAIKEAAEKAGVTPDMEVSDMCEAMKTAMTEITIDGLTGEGMTWNANGEPEKAPKAVKIVDGVYNAM